MAGFIFPNASYLISYKFSPDQRKVLKKLASQHHIKFAFDDTFEGLEQTLSKVKYGVGIFLNVNGLPLAELKEMIKMLDKSLFPVRLFDPDSLLKSPIIVKEPISDEVFAQALQECLTTLRVARLDELVTFTTNVIQPLTMKGLKATFAAAPDGMDLTDLNQVVMCDSTSEEFFGRVTLRANLDKLKQHSEEYKAISNNKALDMIFEFVNQFMGMINHNLSLIGLDARVGLPAHYDMNVSKITRTGPYVPVFSVTDEHHIFHISLGFINIQGGKKMDFKDITFSERESEFEFF